MAFDNAPTVAVSASVVRSTSSHGSRTYEAGADTGTFGGGAADREAGASGLVSRRSITPSVPSESETK